MSSEHVRSVAFRAADRDDDSDDGLTLAGYASTFGDWYDVRDHLGEYRERVMPGAFAKTISERAGQIKVQYDHGRHPLIGSVPLGALREIREDSNGLYVEARLHDNWMTEPIRDAIRSGAVDGMSMRFSVTRDEWDHERDPIERSIREVKLLEVGPVAWPANEATSLALRSLASHLDPDTAADVFGDMIGGDKRTSGSTPPAEAGTCESDAADDESAPTVKVTRSELRRMKARLGVMKNERASGDAA